MRSLGHLPIRQKVILVSLLTTSVALLLALAAMCVYELTVARRGLRQELQTLSKVLAAHTTAAINFEFREDAVEILNTLSSEPHIIAACIYLNDNTQFASFVRPGAQGVAPARPAPDGIRSAQGSLQLFSPILDEKKQTRVGTIYLQSDLSGVWTRVQLYISVLVGVLSTCFLVAVVLATRLQRVISEPIHKLANTTKLISQNRDFSLRAEKITDDELGDLTTAFNQMLSQIQLQDAAVRQAKDQLESRVQERTRALQSEVTERKRAEESLAEQAKELARSNAELEQFAYVASHDLQEPLRMVANFTQLLARRYKDQLDNEAQEFIQFAVDGAQRMQTLINDLLEYSRVRRKGKPFADVDCNRTLNHVLINLSDTIETAGARVTAEPLPHLQADSGQLIQLLQNLISNAIKFRGSEPPRVHVSATQDHDFWLFRVRDNGIGIEPDHFDRIFVIFQRLHTFTEYPGTGIGLAICKRIVERHNGRIWVESSPGHGSTFCFTIPFQQPDHGHDH